MAPVCAGRVVCRLVESPHRVSGITVVDGTLYLLRCRDTDQIELHDVLLPSEQEPASPPPRYALRRCLSLPRLYRDDWNDLAGSSRHRALYVSNFSMNRVQRVDPDDGAVSLWPLPDAAPCGLSVTRDRHNLLVTLHDARRPGRVVELDGATGECLRTVAFPDGVVWAWHTVDVGCWSAEGRRCPWAEPGAGEYLVSHGYYDEHDHAVTLLAADDGRKSRSFGGGGIPAGAAKLCVPYHVAVDAERGVVFVADHHNGRVVALSAPRLEYRGCFAVMDSSLGLRPRRLFLDASARLLYVGQDGGTVTVFQL